MKTLFIGDIVGRKARNFAIQKIKEFKENKLFDLIIVNVENSAGGFGVTPEICDNFLSNGADVLTSGNHIWDKKEIISYINDTNKLDNVTTVVKATHIIKVIYRFPVTAKAEQIPRICKAIGLSLNIGFKSTSFALDIF